MLSISIGLDIITFFLFNKDFRQLKGFILCKYPTHQKLDTKLNIINLQISCPFINIFLKKISSIDLQFKLYHKKTLKLYNSLKK